ncbi:classical arabinogalactan protein 9-like [Pseudomyrmex gracilis]|uniref:classical arabinogalactan protein 9-like n=1 Tax=Pseudomyrmex gracilis TaxID=219809 RepID=UPI000994F8A8|nr:classical arabinogalactan protein 9-like [Pseudomyrmex gracilis]
MGNIYLTGNQLRWRTMVARWPSSRIFLSATQCTILITNGNRPTRPPATYLPPPGTPRPPPVSTPGPTYLPPYGQQGSSAGVSIAPNGGAPSFPASFDGSGFPGVSGFPNGVVKLSGPAGSSSFASASSSASAVSDIAVQPNYPSQSVPFVSTPVATSSGSSGSFAGYPSPAPGYPSSTPSPPSPTPGYR